MSGHRLHIYKEKRSPFQWIGMCSCGNGIRCNAREDAETFFAREGCAAHAVAAVPSREEKKT